MKAFALRILLFAAAALVLLPASSCQTFDPAPDATLVGDTNGTMSQGPGEPLVVNLSEPVKASSIRVKCVSLAVPGALDGEGNLLDEQSPPDAQAFKDSIVFAYDGANPDDETFSYGAKVELDGTKLTIASNSTFNVSVPYLLIIEPGLEDLAGHATAVRIRMPLTYKLTGGGPTRLPSGYYYFIMNVQYLSQQLRLYADMDVDPKTGIWRGKFTAATRQTLTNTRPGCPSSCPKDKPICQLLNSALPSCVVPSDKQSDLTQFPDFLPDPNLPEGYTFSTEGFAKDEPDGTIAFGTAPFDIDIQVGAGHIEVYAKSTVINGQFVESKTEKGRFVGKGSFSVALVQLNGNGKDPTNGDLTAMTLLDSEVKQVESYGEPIPKLPPK
jgi:hypothetical protein